MHMPHIINGRLLLFNIGRVLLFPLVGSIRGRILHAVRCSGRNNRGQLDLWNGSILRRHQGHDWIQTWHLLASMLEIRSTTFPYGTSRYSQRIQKLHKMVQNDGIITV